MNVAELLPFVLLIGAFWLLIIRPAQRQRAAKAAILNALEPGAKVVTTGGIYGTVVELDDEAVVLEVAPGVQLRLVRGAVGAVQRTPGPDEAGPDSREPDDPLEHSDRNDTDETT
jgi:preprotein translocase subunit YajC